MEPALAPVAAPPIRITWRPGPFAQAIIALLGVGMVVVLVFMFQGWQAGHLLPTDPLKRAYCEGYWALAYGVLGIASWGVAIERPRFGWWWIISAAGILMAAHRMFFMVVFLTDWLMG